MLVASAREPNRQRTSAVDGVDRFYQFLAKDVSSWGWGWASSFCHSALSERSPQALRSVSEWGSFVADRGPPVTTSTNRNVLGLV